MSPSHCSVCLDLAYDQFQAEHEFLQGVPRQPASSPAVYRIIRFEDLRSAALAALAACQNCIFLLQGTSLFWGYNPEDWQINYSGVAVLVPEKREGKALVAFRAAEEDTACSLHEPGLRLEFFSEYNEGAPSPTFGYGNRLPRYLSKNKAGRRLRTWLHCCEETHERCKVPHARLPLRVIDISGPMPILVDFQNEETPFGRYATLSHCWGEPAESRPTTTTKSTLNDRKTGIPPDDLSNLFRDAIQLCQEVGCGYIWIDSLCIIQDDHGDWIQQSQKMADIYSNAHFNIAATSSRNSTCGLFKERWTFGSGINQSRYPVLVYDTIVPSASGHRVFVRPAHNLDHRYITGDLLRLRTLQSPLLNRAWVFQELLLSQRILHVCASELIWECKSATACECGALDTTIPLSAMPVASGELLLSQLPRKQEFTLIQNLRSSAQDMHDFWLRISDQYSSLALTKPSDRGPALAGLVTSVQSVNNGTYLAGLWVEDLKRALLWWGSPTSSPNASRSSDAPTWSWMSRRCSDGSCSITYTFLLSRGFRPDPKTLVTYVPESRTLTSGKCCEITFQGPTVSARVQRVRSADESESGRTVHTEFYVQMIPSLQDSQDPGSYTLALDCHMSPDDPVQPGDMVECLLVGTDNDITFYYTLVVSKCLNATEGYFKRIGVADIGLADCDTAKVKTIIIV